MSSRSRKILQLVTQQNNNTIQVNDNLETASYSEDPDFHIDPDSNLISSNNDTFPTSEVIDIPENNNFTVIENVDYAEDADFHIDPDLNLISSNNDTFPTAVVVDIPENNNFTVVENVDIQIVDISECDTKNYENYIMPFEDITNTTVLSCSNVTSVARESWSTNQNSTQSSSSYFTNNTDEQLPSTSAQHNLPKPDAINDHDISDESDNGTLSIGSVTLARRFTNILDKQLPSTSASAQNNLRKRKIIIDDHDISDESENDRALVPYSEHSDSVDSVDSDLPTKSKKRKKRFQVKKDAWFGEKNKLRRERGRAYFGRMKREGKWSYDMERTPREMKIRCTCRGRDKSLIKCAIIPEEDRKTIFQHFWNLTWGEKKNYIDNAVKHSPVSRQRGRKNPEHSRRGQTLFYYLRVNEQPIRVCRTMFLNTLSIGRWTVLNWKNTSVSDPARKPSSYRVQKNEKAAPFEAEHLSLLEFIDSLPAMESHYCRSTTTKKYLLPEWKSKQALYKFYIEDWCKTRDIAPLSISSFNNALNLRNIALFRPKKDECEKCAAYKVGQVSETEYQLHTLKKNEARIEKENDTRNETYIFTVDLQSVLMSPKSNVSSLYYRTKLCVHNLCFFNLRTKDGYCYIWNESEGGLTAEDFATCFSYFIETQILPTIDKNADPPKIIMYSDGCTYQNRNNVIANAALNLAMLHNVTIVQKYLEVGHTQMEVDAMHSTIERCLRNRTINVPADYAYICRIARKKPRPYLVKYLDHTFFKSFKKVSFVGSIRPGWKKGDAKVTDIRALKFTPTGELFYKLRFTDEWETLPQRKKGAAQSCPLDQLDNLYPDRLKIKARKFNDLQELKKVLDVDFHEYYDNIPHE